MNERGDERTAVGSKGGQGSGAGLATLCEGGRSRLKGLSQRKSSKANLFAWFA